MMFPALVTESVNHAQVVPSSMEKQRNNAKMLDNSACFVFFVLVNLFNILLDIFC